MKLMITDGGPHPADLHAATTAESILDLIQISGASQSEDAAAARRAKLELMPKLANVFEPHFITAQETEKAALAGAKGLKRLNTPLDPTNYIEATFGEVLSAITSYPVFAPLVTDNEPFHQAVVGILGARFATALDIERCWRADADLDHPESIAFWEKKETTPAPDQPAA
jgi:hypothetical protein